jgi:hypothetical protein
MTNTEPGSKPEKLHTTAAYKAVIPRQSCQIVNDKMGLQPDFNYDEHAHKIVVYSDLSNIPGLGSNQTGFSRDMDLPPAVTCISADNFEQNKKQNNCNESQYSCTCDNCYPKASSCHCRFFSGRKIPNLISPKRGWKCYAVTRSALS